MKKKTIKKRMRSQKKKVTRRVSTRKKPVLKKRRAVRKVTAQKVRKPILEPIGLITHYFPQVKAGVIKVTKGRLALGDTIHIKGHTTDFKQKIVSLQLDHQPIQSAQKGQEVGIQVKSRVWQHDLVFKL